MAVNPEQSLGVEARAERGRVVAAFDFDGTLVPGDSLIPFLWGAVGPLRFLGAVVRHGPRVALATAAGIGSRDRAKAAFVGAAVKGLPMATVSSAGERFAQRLAARVEPSALARVEWHKEAGHEVVVISASLHVYLGPFGEHLGLDAVLATELAVGTDGRLTGALDGGNVRGQAKLDRLRRWLGGDSCELWAYGDSAGDRELLAAADHGFLVPHGGFAALGLVRA